MIAHTEPEPDPPPPPPIQKPAFPTQRDERRQLLCPDCGATCRDDGEKATCRACETIYFHPPET
jgi:hypothetical protein